MATACLMGFDLASVATFFLNACLEVLLMSGTTRSRIRYEKICSHCKIQFTVPAYRKETALFCSLKCKAFAARQQIIADCAECGNKFTHISSRANKAKYCGPECYHKAMSRKGKTKYQCVHCGIDFLGALSQKRKFCSRACVNKAAKEIWRPDFATVRKNMLKRNQIVICERCGYDTHPEILGVHHKDRDRKNNDLSNLEVLCPNCHSLEHSKHVCHGFSE